MHAMTQCRKASLERALASIQRGDSVVVTSFSISLACLTLSIGERVLRVFGCTRIETRPRWRVGNLSFEVRGAYSDGSFQLFDEEAAFSVEAAFALCDGDSDDDDVELMP